MRITCDGRSVLLTGDLDRTGQAELLTEPQKLKCDVLVLPHHGGWESTLPDFVRAAEPRVVLASCASRPGAPAAAGEPGRSFYRRLRNGYRFYSTARHGWVRIDLDPAKLRVTTMR